MDSEHSIIYGLEFHARVLTPHHPVTDKIQFFIGTQSLNQINNQIHLVELQDNSVLKSRVFYHTLGELWKLNSSPIKPYILSSVYSAIDSKSVNCTKRTAILKVPENSESNNIDNVEVIVKFGFDNNIDIISNELHPTDESHCITLSETSLSYWDISNSDAKQINVINNETKNHIKFTNGKWNPHQNCTQFTTSADSHVKTYDIKSGQQAWKIDCAHSQSIRDLDFNLNKQYYLATCGDDAFIKIWDFRKPSQPVYSRSDHSHWIWCVRFNPFHDQLLLTASSDARVLVSSAMSVSSESNGTFDISLMEELAEAEDPSVNQRKQSLTDGPLQWCEHEESVYCADWSPADPWIFASLSYDGRLLISQVKKSLKYKIML